MKLRVLRLLLGLFVLAGVTSGAGILYLRSQLDSSNLRDRIVEILLQRTGRTARLDSAALTWDADLDLKGFSLLDAAALSPQISAESARIELSPLAFLSGGFPVRRVTMVKPEVSLTRLADGTTDLDDVLKMMRERGGGGSTPNLDTRISIKQGVFALEDRVGQARHRIDALDLDAGLSLTAKVWFDGKANLDGRPMAVRGEYRVPSNELAFGVLKITPRERLEISLDPAVITFKQGGASLAPTGIQLNGTPGKLQLAYQNGIVEGGLEFPGADARQLGTDIQGGKVDLKVTVAGPVGAPLIAARARVEGVLINGGQAFPGRLVHLPQGELDLVEFLPGANFSGRVKVKDLGVEIQGGEPAFGFRILQGEIQAAPDSVEGKGLVIEIQGNRIEPRFRVTGLPQAPYLDLETQPLDLDLGSLTALLPASVRDTYAQYSPRGRLRLAVSASGPAASPALQGSATFAGVTFVMPATRETVGLPEGRVVMTGNDLQIPGAVLSLRDTQLSVKGQVRDFRSTAALDLAMTGRQVSLAPFADRLPPGVRALSPEVVADVDLTVKGTPSAPVVDGSVKPQSGSIRLGAAEGATVLTLEPGGSIGMKAGAIHVTKIKLRAGDRDFRLSAEIRPAAVSVELAGLDIQTKDAGLKGSGLLRLGDTPAFENMRLEGGGRLEALMPHGGVSGGANLVVALTGPAAAPRLTGSVGIPQMELHTPSGATLRVGQVKASFEGDPTGFEVNPIQAGFYGGRLQGRTRFVQQKGIPEFDITLTGTDLSALRAALGADPTLVRGRLSARFAGSGPMVKLAGNGEATVADLEIDMTQNRMAGLLGTGLGAGAAGSKILAGELGNTFLKNVFNSSSNTAGYFQQVLNEVVRVHSMGTVVAPLTAREGALDIGPFQQDRLAGQVRIDLAQEMALSGRIDYVRLGRVQLANIGLGGTISSPKTPFDLNNLTLAGQPPPQDAATLGATLLGGGSLGEGLQRGLETHLRGEAKKKGSRLLGDLLGVPREQDPAADPGALPADADGYAPPQNPNASEGEQLLESLKGDGGGQSQPAPQDPGAAAPSEEPPRDKDLLKEAGKSLLKDLFR